MKSSYRPLRVITYILRIVGAVTFSLSLFNFCIVLYIWKSEGQYVSSTQGMGLTVYTIVIGLILFLAGAVISLLCDIADNTKGIVEKEWKITAPSIEQKPKENITNHTRYMP